MERTRSTCLISLATVLMAATLPTSGDDLEDLPEYPTPCIGCTLCNYYYTQFLPYCKCTITEIDRSIRVEWDEGENFSDEPVCILNCSNCEGDLPPIPQDTCMIRDNLLAGFDLEMPCDGWSLQGGNWFKTNPDWNDDLWSTNTVQLTDFIYRIGCALGERKESRVYHGWAPATLTVTFKITTTCKNWDLDHPDFLDNPDLPGTPFNNLVLLGVDPNEDEDEKDIPFDGGYRPPRKGPITYDCGVVTMTIAGTAHGYREVPVEGGPSCKE